MNDEVEVVQFSACKHLDYDRRSYHKSVTMAILHHFQDTKVCWERKDFDGKLELVQFCKVRGRLPYPTACLNDKEPCVCSLYEESSHVVPLKDINL